MPDRSIDIAGKSFLSGLLLAGVLCGCNGKSVKYDNPVFSPPPPRTSVTSSQMPAEESEPGETIREAGLERELGSVLTGSTVVATVNSQPVFLDDVLGGVRQMLEADSRLSDEQRQVVLSRELGKRIDKYTHDEVVMQAVNLEIPSDRREAIRESLQPAFDEIVEGILEKEKKSSRDELDTFLVTQGTSLRELQDNFVRMQLVEGYLSTHARASAVLSRQELEEYYRQQILSYTSEEQVRYAKIVIRFSEAGGREAAVNKAHSVRKQIAAGRSFAELALQESHALSRERGGDMGWVKRGSLQSNIEESIFGLNVGGVSDVITLQDRCEIYSCTDRHAESVIPFADLQQELEKELLQVKKQEARQRVLDELVKDAAITKLFAEEPVQESAITPFSRDVR